MDENGFYVIYALNNVMTHEDWMPTLLAGAGGQRKQLDRMVPGKSWYTWFRLYGPLEAYFDKSWPLPDIELVK